MEIDECVNESVGRFRRHPAAAAAAALSCNAQPSGPHHGTQNAIIKSLLNKLRLSGSKLKSEKFNFSIPGSASSDTPLNQAKQTDQLDRNGRVSAGVSPFEMTRGLQPSQRPSPTVHPMRFDAGADATPLISSSTTGPTPHLLPAQRSMDGGLPTQHSWGSPRSDPMRSSDAGALEAFRSFSLGGLGLGSSSGGGAQSSKYVRPANVPPLNLGRIANREDLAAKQRQGGVPSSPGASGSQSAGGGPPPLTPHQFQQHLLESLVELEEELASWAAPPRWNPSSQGRWYLYPPIGRKDVNPVEQLLESLAPNQASAVVLLWRQYAAARYSAELMAGRAVRLCRELGHELAECRAEVEERTTRHADHAAQLGKAIMRLQQQLEEARRAAAAATSAAAAATAAAAAQQSAEAGHQQQQVDGGSLRLSQSLPTAAGHGNSPVRRQSSRTLAGASPAAAAAAHVSGRGGASSAADREKRLTGRMSAEELLGESDDMAVQLEQMRQLFLEAHEDSRALREALMEVDEQNMQLYEQSNGLRRHAAAVLRENDALRTEVAQLRGLITGGAAAGGGGASSLAAAAAAAAASTSAAASSASTAAAVAAAAADAASGGGGSAAANANTAPRRGRSQYSGKNSTSSSGGGGNNTSSETGMRASVNLPLGIKEHMAAAAAAAAASPPPRPPLSSAAGSAPPAAAAAASTPGSASGRRSDSGVTGAAAAVRASVRRPVGSGAGADPNAPPLPPTRASSARAKSTTRGGSSSLTGGRSSAVAAASATGDQMTAMYGNGSGAGNKSGGGGGGATADRANRRALTEALAAEGAVVMVHASSSRRAGNSTHSGGYATPSRSRTSTEPVHGHSNFVTDAALSKAGKVSAGGGGGSGGGNGNGGGVFGGGDGALQYGTGAL